MSDENTTNEPTQGAEAPAKTFTQDELEKIVGDRLARERKKYADYDELRAFKDEHKSETEKAIEAARVEGAKEVTERFSTRLFQSEVRAAAAALGFRDAGDAVAVFGDSSGLVSSEGEVDAKAIQERLTELAKAKPYLVTESSRPATRPTIRRGSSNHSTSDAKPKRAAEALRAFAQSR